MHSKNALKEFEGFLRRNGDRSHPKAPATGFARMVAFYQNVRADDVALDAGGDMLLFQWGTYDWGRGPKFEVDLSRQFIREDGEDDDIWQLHLTYRFAPTDVLRELGEGDRWCERSVDLAAFESFVINHPVLKAVGSREDGKVKVDYECAG